jgi:hypothetical protein
MYFAELLVGGEDRCRMVNEERERQKVREGEEGLEKQEAIVS